jgi:hypothetical protein
MKTKYQNKTQSQKKRKMQQQTQPVDHLLRSPSSPGKKQNSFLLHRRPAKKNQNIRFFFIAGRPNPTGRPPSPVTIIAKKKKKNKTCFFFIAGWPNPTSTPPSPVKTQPKKSILMPQN